MCTQTSNDSYSLAFNPVSVDLFQNALKKLKKNAKEHSKDVEILNKDEKLTILVGPDGAPILCYIAKGHGEAEYGDFSISVDIKIDNKIAEVSISVALHGVIIRKAKWKIILSGELFMNPYIGDVQVEISENDNTLTKDCFESCVKRHAKDCYVGCCLFGCSHDCLVACAIGVAACCLVNCHC